MGQVVLDAFLDTLKVLPFLLLIYILIELLEHKTTVFSNGKILRGGFAPLIASAAGLIPLCGFSVMAAKLYDKRYIRTGALLSVFIATSDEAVIVLLSGFELPLLYAVLPLIISKFVIALTVGYAADLLLRKERLAEPQGETEEYVCAHEHGSKTPFDIYFLGPLWHALKIALYLFAVTLVFGILVYFYEDGITSALAVSEWVQPLISAAVGLVPSCASSVIITTAYAQGIIKFGSMVAGLIINAGMGFVILLKNPKNIKRTLLIILTLYAVSYLSGIALNALAPYIGL